jgi:PST family polysaccharide transporter
MKLEKYINERKQIKNFIAVSFLQLSNLIIPVLVIPHIISVIGVEKFGIVSLVQVIMNYFGIIIDYCYNLLGVRDIALNRNSPMRMRYILSKVFWIKLILCFITLILLSCLILAYPQFNQNKSLVYLSFFIVLGHLFNPSWFFQGVENMRFISILNLFSKLIFLILIFNYIKDEKDSIYINFYLGCSNFMLGLLGYIYAFKRYDLKLYKLKIIIIFGELKKGGDVFTGIFSANVYIQSNVIILGYFSTPFEIGCFSIVEKVVNIIRTILVVFSQVIYPHLCIMSKKNHNEIKSFFRFQFTIFLLGIIFLCFISYIYSPFIINFLSKHNIVYLTKLLRLFVIVPFIVCLNIPFYQTLLAYNKTFAYSKVFLIGALISLISNSILCLYFGATGTITSIIFTETIITILFFRVLENNYPQYSLISK